MICLLDTDTFIFMVRGLKLSAPKNGWERKRHRLALRIQEQSRKRQSQGDDIGLSAITVAELEYGARHSANYATEISAVHKVLTPFQVWDFAATVATEQYGIVRHELEAAGVVIGAMDLLIAAHARALGATLVTNNTAHFSRVKNLACDNWAR